MGSEPARQFAREVRGGGLTESLRTALILLLFTGFMAASGWLWRWDLLLYDLQMGWMTHPASDDIVIVAVDEKSLESIGRWPWPRFWHAQLIDQLSQAGARAIVFDILLAEPDPQDPEGDRKLIQSVAASERVYFPVILEQRRQGGMLVETLPIPALANVAAGLGHVHIDLDADGIARGVYLYEGLGDAYWPHLTLSLLHGLSPGQYPLQSPPPAGPSPDVQRISRHSHRMIPYAGPAGHYPRYSYSQVVDGRFQADAFRERIVLVGVTATGIGDALPTPLSGYGVPMPGVEINANILDSLRRGEEVTPVAALVQMLANALVVLVPFLLYPYFPTRAAPLVSILVFTLFVISSGILLRGMGIWLPPAAGLLGLALSYPLWSWRRLDQAVRYLNEQLERLQREQMMMPVSPPVGDLTSAMRFLSRLMPLQGWVVYDAARGRPLVQDGDAPGAPLPHLKPDAWARSGAETWTRVTRPESDWQLGFSWPRNQVPEGHALDLLSDFARQFSEPPKHRDGGVLERVELRIAQLRETTARIQRFRNLIQNAVGQMDDGLMVINSHGQVVMSNPRSSLYLGHQQGSDLLGRDAYELLRVLEIGGGGGWEEAFRRVILEGRAMRFEARRQPDTELFVQLQPLMGVEAEFHGMIVNLSNIATLKRTERTRVKMLNFLSHDIRSPITSLLSLTQSQQWRQGNGEALARQIEPLARRSLKLADDFLRLARAEAVETASFQDLDLLSVACNALDEVYIQAKSASVTVTSEFGEEELWLEGDPALLERALFNLLENAVKFSSSDGQVRLSIGRRQGWVICEVSDRGPGLPDELLEEVFQPFVQSSSPSASEFRGVGLGLSFVKVVAEKHRGRVRVENDPAGGARFVFELPDPQWLPD
ncbi:MAG: CHASE2 domain-containing protein [Candidatus Thiodiazotropha sp.]